MASTTPGGAVVGATASFETWRRFSLALGAVAVVTSCQGSDTIVSVETNDGVVDLTTASIAAVGGDSQEAEVASALPNVLTVQVLDARGQAVVGVPIEWTFVDGRGGSPKGGPAGDSYRTSTDSDGRSEAQWTLGTRAGQQQASAQIVLSDSPDAVDGLSGISGLSGAPKNDNGKKIGFYANAKPGRVEEVSVSPEAAETQTGDSVRLQAYVTDVYGNVIEGSSVSWSSSDQGVAVVDGTGLVTGKGGGVADITAKSGSALGSAQVSVLESSDSPDVPDSPTVSSPEITTSSLPDGMVGVGYSTTLAASDGGGSYRWSITSGSLPSGLTLNASSGVIAGTPASEEYPSFTVRVEDGGGLSDTQQLSLRVVQPVEPPVTTGYPNEPGHFTLISLENGAKTQWDGWRNNSPAWNGDNLNGGPPRSVADATCPVFDRAVEFRTEAGTHGDGSNKIWFSESIYQNRLSMDSLYVSFYMYRDVTESRSHKWFYVGQADGSNPIDYYMGGAGSTNPGGLRFIAQGNAGADEVWRDGRELFKANRWVLFEMLLGREAAAGAQNGHMSVWIDGTRIFSSNNISYTSSGDAANAVPFGGLTWYSWENDPSPIESYYRVCGLKLSGKPTS